MLKWLKKQFQQKVKFFPGYLQEKVDYECLDSVGSFMLIKILKGSFRDVIYSYDYIQVTELKMSYEYTVYESPVLGNLDHNHDFEIHIGDILVSIFWDATNNPDTTFDMKVLNEP